MSEQNEPAPEADDGLEDEAAYSSDALQGVAGKKVDFQSMPVEAASRSVQEFLDRLMRNQPASMDLDRRVHKRHHLRVPIPMVPVNEAFQPIGPAFKAFARDISIGGLSFLHTREVPEKRLVTEILLPSGEPRQLVVEILRCRSVGRFFEISGRWVAKLS